MSLTQYHGETQEARPPVSIPPGAVLIGHSLYIFPDPELAVRVLQQVSNGEVPAEVYGGQCVYYGYPLAPYRPSGTRQALRSLVHRLTRRKRRIRHPVRFIGGLVSIYGVIVGLISRNVDLVLAGLILAAIVTLHQAVTGGRSHA